MEKLLGTEIIVKFLDLNGFKHIFGIPGRRLLPLYDEIYKTSKNVKLITTRHEEGASFMADCYSRTGGVGCCIGISGPGAIHLLNGTAAAFMDSIPMFVIAGQAQVADMGRYPIQEATGIGRTPNQLHIFKQTTKLAKRVEKVEDLLNILEEAYITMYEGRKGPVYVEVPTNIFTDRCYCEPRKINLNLVLEKTQKKFNINSNIYDNVLNVLAKAEFPVVFVGNGAVSSNATEEMKQFLKKYNLPYVTTLLAKGCLNEKDDMSLGTIGIFGQKAANDIILHKADAILAFGTTFQELATMGWQKEIGEKLKVRIDIDEDEINRVYKAEIPVLADIKEFLTGILKYDDSRRIDFSNLKETIRMEKEEFNYFRIPVNEEEKSEEYMHPAEAVTFIGEYFKGEDIILGDIGENGYWSSMLVMREKPLTYVTNGGLGSMGHAVAGAVGAKLANPNVNVVVICGDGGFLMNGNELATAANYGVKVIWCVLNNGILGTQKHFQRDFYDRRYIGSEVPEIDICKYTESMGLESYRAKNLKELSLGLEKAVKSDNSFVIDVVIDDVHNPKPQCDF